MIYFAKERSVGGSHSSAPGDRRRGVRRLSQGEPAEEGRGVYLSPDGGRAALAELLPAESEEIGADPGLYEAKGEAPTT